MQEMEQAAGAKIDWAEMAKNSATGISCAREYHMLWRHLAYGEALIDQLDSDAERMVCNFSHFWTIFCNLFLPIAL